MNRNYQKELDRIIQKRGQKVPRVLLHACCGVCSGAVLEYLTENESIPCVTAWCAAENIGSKRVLEKAGMKLVCTEKNSLVVEDRVYDKLTYHFEEF